MYQEMLEFVQLLLQRIKHYSSEEVFSCMVFIFWLGIFVTVEDHMIANSHKSALIFYNYLLLIHHWYVGGRYHEYEYEYNL